MLVAKTTPAVIPHPSPNHGERKSAIDMLVLHYTDTQNARDALDLLCTTKREASAHYLIDMNGDIYALVPEERRAWHAGVSSWKGMTDINSCSIGIELVNPGHRWGYRPFPDVQIAALIPLCRDIIARHGIPANRVLGHSDVAPTRKRDPGELFDWAQLAREGIGLWPAEKHPAAPCENPAGVLAEIGYETPAPETLPEILTAFQRHFLPGHLTGTADARTCARLMDVLELFSGNR